MADVLPEPQGCQLTVGEPLGIAVNSVIEETAADGIFQPGDLIVAVEGAPTPTTSALVEQLASKRPGDILTVRYRRDGAEDEVTLTLGTHPDDQTRPFIGVVIRTAYETVRAEEATGPVAESPQLRLIQIGSTLYAFDPLQPAWEATGIEVPEGQGWIATYSDVYSLTGGSELRLVSLIGGPVDDDGFQGWDPRRLLGSVGNDLALMVTSAIPEQPGFVNVAIALFDPNAGETRWVTPILAGFGIPTAVAASPDTALFLVTGVDQNTGELTGVDLYDVDGTRRELENLEELGVPVGWFDESRVAFRSQDDVVSVFDTADATVATFTLPEQLLGAPVAAVGDGAHLLAVSDRDLLIVDLLGGGEIGTLAADCSILRIGEPGWQG